MPGHGSRSGGENADNNDGCDGFKMVGLAFETFPKGRGSSANTGDKIKTAVSASDSGAKELCHIRLSVTLTSVHFSYI